VKFCLAFAHIHCMVWCNTSLFFQSYWNPILCTLSWWYSLCCSYCV